MLNKSFVFSIIMPALNSECTIRKSLESIRNQNFDQTQVEIIVLDGNSTDKTAEIASEFGCTLLPNPKVQQEYAKHIGLLNASGKYAVFLDSDEVFGSMDALKNRLTAFENNPDVKVVQFGGYKCPSDSSSINDYINIIGDPFAYFMYHISSDSSYFLNSWKKRYPNFIEKDYGTIFKYEGNVVLPAVDMCAGNTLDLAFFKITFKEQLDDPMIVPLIYYMLVQKTHKSCVLKNDTVIHYSADSTPKYFKKLQWRVRANIHYKEMPGTGFVNREDLNKGESDFRKYFFLIYAFTLVLPVFDSLYWLFKTKKNILLLHLPASLYVATTIIYEYVCFLLGYKPTLTAYGKGKAKINI